MTNALHLQLKVNNLKILQNTKGSVWLEEKQFSRKIYYEETQLSRFFQKTVFHPTKLNKVNFLSSTRHVIH